MTFTFTDPNLDALDAEDRRALAVLYQVACLALDAASPSMREAVAREVQAGGEIMTELVDDKTVVVVRVGVIEVLRASQRTIAQQMLAAEHAAVN